MISKIRICLDFDGVLHDYGGWDGPIPTGRPVPGALEFVNWLIKEGYEPVVYSARTNHSEGSVGIQIWLNYHDFPTLEIFFTKPAARLYVDDRGYRFEGDFGALAAYLVKNPLPSRWGKEEK